MDLKIKDVAELLNVSEKTIRRWLSAGKIPAYNINGQYRFSRTEIEQWVMNHKLGKTFGKSPFTPQQLEKNPLAEKAQTLKGATQYSLYRALHHGSIYYHIPGKTKQEVIHHTMQQLAEKLELDPDVLTELLLDREEMMPTALNNGIGVPHTRDFLLDGQNDVVVLAFLENPIEYGALDGKRVELLFFLFASDDKRHLNLLAKIAHLSSDAQSLQFLLSKPDKNSLLTYIKDWEGKITRECEVAKV